MANYSTLEHSKTLGKTQIPNFSSLASTSLHAAQDELDLYPGLGRGRSTDTPLLPQRNQPRRESTRRDEGAGAK